MLLGGFQRPADSENITGANLLAFAKLLAGRALPPTPRPTDLIVDSWHALVAAGGNDPVRYRLRLLGVVQRGLRGEGWDDCLGTLRITGVSRTFQVPSPDPDPHRCPWERFALRQSFAKRPLFPAFGHPNSRC
jgi:hypothetical protein